jgi:hypothetical protein
MRKINLPGYTAEASFVPAKDIYRRNAVFGRLDSAGVMPQLRFQFQSDPDLGAYLRCRANGGSELICRFFGGLPPFTIGGLLF